MFARSEVIATVSGGGYTGTGVQLLRHSANDAERPAFAANSRELELLRQRQRYLWATPTPGHRVQASREFATAMLVAVAGIVFNVTLLLTVAYVLARPLGWAAHGWLDVGGAEWSSALTLTSAVGAAAAIVVLAIVTTAAMPTAEATFRRVVLVAAGGALVWFAVHVRFPSGFEWSLLVPLAVLIVLFVMRSARIGLASLTAAAMNLGTALVPTLFALLVWAWIDRGRHRGPLADAGTTVIEIVAPVVIATVAAVLIAAVVFSVSAGLSVTLRAVAFVGWVAVANAAVLWWWWIRPDDRIVWTPSWIEREWQVWLAYVVLLVVVYLTLDQKRWSPHSFYKRRLAHAFAHQLDDVDEVRPLPWRVTTTLSEYGVRRAPGPEHVVCAAAYDTDSTGLKLPVQPYTFSARQVGGPWLGYCRTVDFEASLGYQNAPDGTLLAAMAISGAAVSPAIGQTDMGAVSPLISMVNGRLGVWLPNPRYVNDLYDGDGEPGAPVWLRLRRFTYLLQEVFGSFHPDGRFVYVTDGGQLDNLGLLELLRRGCTTIVLIDATGDNGPGKNLTTSTFDGVRELAEKYHGIQFSEAGLAELRTLARVGGDEARWPKGELAPKVDQAVAVIPFRYPGDPNVADDPYPNRIVYGKAVVTAALADVPTIGTFLADRRSAARFPSDSTMNQFFGDEQFEAYRCLGEEVGQRVVAATAPFL